MKRWVASLIGGLVMLAGMAAPVAAQTALHATTCPGSGCTQVRTDGAGSVGIQVVGTFVGTLQFEQSNDNATWVALSLTSLTADSTVTSATAPGFWSGTVAGVARVRVRFSAYTSGTATVYAASAAAKLGGSGGTIPSDITADSVCLNKATPLSCLTYGPPAGITGGFYPTPILANSLVLYAGATDQTNRQGLAIIGANNGVDDFGYIMLTPPRAQDTEARITVSTGGAGVTNNNQNLFISSQEDGYIAFGNQDTPEIAIGNGNGAEEKAPRGLSTFRNDAGIGFGEQGAGSKSFKAAFMRGCNTASDTAIDGVIKVVMGNTANGCGSMTATDASVEGALFSSTASEVIASAGTIAPTHSIFHVSGTSAIATITVPAQCPHTCTLYMLPDAAFTTTTGGNIKTATTAVANKVITTVWDGTKWYLGQ